MYTLVSNVDLSIDRTKNKNKQMIIKQQMLRVKFEKKKGKLIFNFMSKIELLIRNMTPTKKVKK